MIEKFDPNIERPVTFTQAALKHFKKHLEKIGGLGIKIGIKTTGCSGLAYVVEPIHELPQGFIRLEEQGVLFFVDPKALQYVNGLEIDHIKRELGLSQLVYKNPNESARCGCGESFTVIDEGLKG
ncbi:HesB/IscA family protein [Fastidiosibacter lacustris]|uniref:HesB/IscA family protein n=1 Tax=Fastidiosibacter lacustris TaxID=2056695 RepID=UPI000E3556CA|nr:iron-sulfur cluster assembly accessory protein [Fastidiosibacter lacustris]